MNQILREQIKNPEKYNFFRKVTYKKEDGTDEVKLERARLFISNLDRLCYYGKGKHRYGYPVDENDIVVTEKKSIKTPEQKWRQSWLKVVDKLEKSGLYEDLLPNVKLALEIGYDKIKKAYEIYWKTDKNLSYEENKKLRNVEIKNLDEKLILKGSPNTEILWHIGEIAKVKKMNFGRYTTEEKLNEIKEALRNKKAISVSGRTNYDVSFSYNPKINKAWYSEEYKNCGNGHYYLALDSTHALFYEND